MDGDWTRLGCSLRAKVKTVPREHALRRWCAQPSGGLPEARELSPSFVLDGSGFNNGAQLGFWPGVGASGPQGQTTTTTVNDRLRLGQHERVHGWSEDRLGQCVMRLQP